MKGMTIKTMRGKPLYIDFYGKKQSVAELAHTTGLERQTIVYRHKHGYKNRDLVGDINELRYTYSALYHGRKIPLKDVAELTNLTLASVRRHFVSRSDQIDSMIIDNLISGKVVINDKLYTFEQIAEKNKLQAKTVTHQYMSDPDLVGLI